MVRFRYQRSDMHQWKSMTLPANEFLRRFMQHLLPQGFNKVRYNGLLSPSNRANLKRLKLFLTERARPCRDDKEITPKRADKVNRCPCCEQGVMVIIDWLPRRSRSPPAPVGC
jgi:hypothetical protein